MYSGARVRGFIRHGETEAERVSTFSVVVPLLFKNLKYVILNFETTLGSTVYPREMKFPREHHDVKVGLTWSIKRR